MKSSSMTPAVKERYTSDTMSAREAQRLAEYIAFGPVIFQTARIMLRRGLLGYIRDSLDGVTMKELEEFAGIGHYAVQCLVEASLSIGLIYIDPETDRIKLTKTGWFIVTDPAVNVNIDFNHDVNYLGWHRLEESLVEGRPAGLEHFGKWSTIYEGLSQLPEDIRRSWLAFDHFYSDSSFDKAREIVFSRPCRTLLDVGGNTGRWAAGCVAYDPEVRVTIVDLPGQIAMMEEAVASQPGADRINGYAMDILDEKSLFPAEKYDAVWMSQFLDCFSESQVVSILSRARRSMDQDSRLYIMETMWDCQRFEPAALCLTLTSLYFTALANGNSKMFASADLYRLIDEAGLEVAGTHHNLGQGHSIIICKLKN